VLDDLAGRGDLGEERFAGPAAALFLFEDRLAQIDALAADVNVAGSFHQRADIAITLAAERTEGIFLGSATTTASSVEIPS
jgi:hypothetical protein